MDELEWSKIVGGLCGAFLVLLMVKWGAETVYHVGDSHGGHGEYGAAHASSYPIEIADSSSGNAAADEAGPDLGTLLALKDHMDKLVRPLFGNIGKVNLETLDDFMCNVF